MQREFKISLSQEFYSDIVYLSQYDSDYPVIFTVTDKYSKASGINGYTAKFTGTRGDGTGLGFTYTATAIGHTVSFTIDTMLTGVAGTHTGEIIFYDQNDLYFGTANVQIIVEPAARPDGTIDADEEELRDLAQQCQDIVDTAAAEVKGEAESWAVGERDGEPVPSTDPTYHNNAKYYAEQAQDIADSIGIDATLSVSGKAADAKKTGDEISSLKEELTDVKEEITYIENDGTARLDATNFVNGGLNANTGEIINGQNHRVASLNNIVYSRDISITPASGYRFYVLYMSGSTVSQQVGWQTAVYTIPKNQEFKLLIAKVTEDTSSVADIDTFVNTLSLTTYITGLDNKIDLLESSLDDRIDDLESFDTHIVEPFDTIHIYEMGDMVSYQGHVYAFNRKHAAGAWQSAHVYEINRFTELYRSAIALNYAKKVHIFTGSITPASTNNFRNIPPLSDATAGNPCMFMMIGPDSAFPAGYRVLSNSGSVYVLPGYELLKANQVYVAPLPAAYVSTSFGPYLNVTDSASSVAGDFTFVFAYDVSDMPNGVVASKLAASAVMNELFGKNLWGVFNLMAGNRDARVVNPATLKAYAGKPVKFLIESDIDNATFRVLTSDNISVSEDNTETYSPNLVYTRILNPDMANTISTRFGPYLSEASNDNQLIKFTIWYDLPEDEQTTNFERVNSALKGKTLWTLWDSLGINTWQDDFVADTGCTFLSGLNTLNSKPLSKGGTATNPVTDDGGQARARNLVSYKNDHDIDILIIENINDIEAVQNSNVGAITDAPFMRSQKITIDSEATSYADAVTYINNNLSTILSNVASADRLPGTVLSFVYSTGSAICGSQVAFAGTASSEGDITLTWQGATYAVHATVGMTADEVAQEFIKYSFGSGTTDRYLGDATIVITYYTETASRVSFSGGDTGITATVTDSVGRSEVARFFSGVASEWTDTTKWQSNCSLYSQYKGMIEYLLTNLPNTDIFWCIPFAIAMDFSNSTYKRADGSWDIDKINAEYTRAIVTKSLFDAQKAVCDLYGIAVLDVEKNAGVSYANIESFYNSSNVHPKAVGYKRYADVMARLIGKVY